jgi:hypothetical protein
LSPIYAERILTSKRERKELQLALEESRILAEKKEKERRERQQREEQQR